MTLANLVRCYTLTEGVLDIVVDSAVLGFLDFSAVPNGATVSYGLQEGNQNEVGRGVWNSGTQTLTRVPLASTNGGSKIVLRGHAQVFVTALAEDFALAVPYGAMYADDISLTVAVAAPDVYYPILSSLLGSLCSSDFTFQNSRELRCNRAGTYVINWGMSITSSNNNENISGAAMINNTEVHTSEGSAQCINFSKPVHVSGSGIVSLIVGDLVRLCVQNEDAAHNVTVYHANLTITGLT